MVSGSCLSESLGPSFLSSVSLFLPSFLPGNGTYQVQTLEKVHMLDVDLSFKPPVTAFQSLKILNTSIY